MRCGRAEGSGNANTIDIAVVGDLEIALQSETPPALTELESIYLEAGIALPGLAVKRYDEVRSFHESVIRNRRDYLSDELTAAKQRISRREQERQRHDQRRAEVMGVLQSHGALEQFAKLQGEAGRIEAEVESLRQRFESAEKLEGTKNELEIERNRLALRLRRDFGEQRTRLDEAIEDCCRPYKLLRVAALKIDVTTSAPARGIKRDSRAKI